MYRTIEVNNLRAITKLVISDCGRINLVVGNNSCGKTTFLEAIFFLIGATNPKLPVNANIFRQLPFLSNWLWRTYFHDMELTTPITITGQIRETSVTEQLIIRPRIGRPGPAESATSDAFVAAPGSSDSGIEPDGLKLEHQTSSAPGEKTECEVFLKGGEKGGEFVTSGTKERDLRGVFVAPSTVTDWSARFAQVQRKKRLDDVISLLRNIEPKISDLRLNEIGFLEADIGLAHLIPAKLMGGGLAKLLSIALAMLDYQDGIVLIDEIENGLHQVAQASLWQAVLSWAQTLNVQVFATTHSRECVTAFSKAAATSLFASEAKLFRIERAAGRFRTVEYTSDLLAEAIQSNWEFK